MREFSLPARYTVPTEGGLPKLLAANAARHPHTAVIARQRGGTWEDLTATEFLADVESVARGLLRSGVQPGDRVGLLSRTRYEWTLFDFAIWTVGAVTVPVYESSSPEQIAWNLGDSGAIAVVVETSAQLAVVESLRERLPRLTRRWCVEPDSGPGAVALLTAAGAPISDQRLAAATATVTPDSPATIVYTSGTTGRPRGCVLSHRAFLATCGNVVAALGPLFRTGESSVLLFLPLAHVFARMVQVAALLAPIRLGLVPSVAQLTDDLASFRPTIVLGVPRVFEKVYNSARATAASGGRGKIFDRAAETAAAYSRAQDTPGGPGLGLRLRHRVFDRLVYRKLRAVLGGRATHAISGGAPLGERLGHFYRGIGFTVLEGYGLTESCAPTSFNPWDAPRIGTVGRPLPGTTIRIAEDDEILLRGEHLFTEYWNDPAATAEVLRDGWFHTGDLGRLDEAGYLTVTGRSKEILVTAGGKNVAPAVLEDRIRAHALVAECMVVGEGRPFVGALLTVDDDFLPRWAEEQSLTGLDRAELLDHPALLAALDEAVRQANEAVSRAESVRAFRVLPGHFTEESGHLTPSLKLKRHVVAKDFATEIDALYGT
ncbi:AMP-binding protein [Streptomyces sp. 3MP-14]|uniref:Acyl-CoA synthetase n=1 Tax=Streptomyces mimosae TaxID=2586635 RepID=A0A5N6AIV0_9ACTN|nr:MULTISPECIES: AMP-dependent synthetase/ligase [Streptomyces]KAB8168631.1 AMP-binding protein [Streptomyces mimosae]KAB8178089.1 AMP-binding protein [Streptomyces sp. 3MP-14]